MHHPSPRALPLQPLTFAVMPSNDGAAASESAAFFTHVTTAFPDTAEDHWAQYDSESAFIDIIDDSDYSRDPTDDRPAFAAGIVFTSGSPNWAYTVGVGADVLTSRGRGLPWCSLTFPVGVGPSVSSCGVWGWDWSGCTRPHHTHTLTQALRLRENAAVWCRVFADHVTTHFDVVGCRCGSGMGGGGAGG